MTVVLLDPNVLALQNTVERVSLLIKDGEVDPVVPTDPESITLNIMSLDGSILSTQEWPAVTTRIVRADVGKFYIELGNQPTNTETECPRELVLNWQVEMEAGGEITNTLQKLKVISVLTASYLPELRLIIDKSHKLAAPNSDCFLGYTDSQLVTYLEGGLQTINAYQPSLTFTMENFPLTYKQVLIDASLITGVISQQLYAIDTDIPNYSDQGTSFVIAHQPQLAGFLNQITQRLDKIIPQMKLQLISSGSLHIQMGPNYRLSTVFEAAPGGSLFRNLFFKA